MAEQKDTVQPLTPVETQFCLAVARLAHQHRIPLERAVELFGRMAHTMVMHDCQKLGEAAPAANKRYAIAFLRGMGAQDVEIDVLEAERPHGTLQ